MNILIMGPPASGKGTLAKELSERYNLKHISTGDLLREEVAKNTPLGDEIAKKISQGEYASDKEVNSLFEKELLKDTESIRGFIFDGYPRNMDQVVHLMQFGLTLNDFVILKLDISSELLQQRVLGRRFCPKCEKSYHLTFKPSANNTHCDSCNTLLLQREDDSREKLKTRMKFYEAQLVPVEQHLKQVGNYVEVLVDNGPLQDNFNRVCDSLKDYESSLRME